MKKTIVFHLGVIAFVLIISIPLLIPYLKSGYFPTHDGEWAVVRLSDMFRELRDFQIPPRYSGNLNFGYGYPLFNFAYPFPYYIGVLVKFLGLSFVDSIKFVFGASTVLSSYFMFLAVRTIWKNDFAALLSSVIYLYFPYRLVDLFVRGSIGETVAFALFPLIFYCISKSMDNPKTNIFKIVGAVSYAALIMSHNIMAVFFSITLVFYFMANIAAKKKHTLNTFVFVGLFGIFLSAFFWIPALLEKGNILLSVIPIADRSQFYVSLKDVFFSSWGYGIPTDRESGFTYQIGFPFIIVIASATGLLIYNRIKKIKKDYDQILAVIFLIGIGFFFLMLFPVSSLLWKLPFLSEINFPWTALSQIGFLSSILVGFAAKQKLTKYITLFAAILALILYIPLAKPSEFVNRGDGFYFTNDGTTTSSNELMPLWVKTHPGKRPDQKIKVLKGEAEINNLFHNSKLVTFDTVSDTASVIRINTIYYPGWNVFENGEKIPINYNNEFGVMDINISSGKHNIEAVFSETRTRLISDLVSAVTLSLLVFVGLRSILPVFRKHGNS